MKRRRDRLARLIQQIVGRIILERLSDPRVDPARVSVTRVEVAEDMTRAKVYCSVLGSDVQQRTAMRALRHAAGHIQELLMHEVSLRFTPMLEFVPDVQFKKSLTTLSLIQQAMDEIRQQEAEQAQRADAAAAAEDPQPEENE